MSYCRWSSDNWSCDLYAYEHVEGFWSLNVAAMRVVGDVPKATMNMEKPQKEAIAEYVEAREAQMEFLKTAVRERIELPEAGKSFALSSPGECADKIEELIALGYRCPDYVVPELRAEQAEMDGGE